MSARPSVPPLRRGRSNPLFSDTTREERAPAKQAVTVYMPPETVADLDQKRAELRRAGERVDRGRLVRAAIAIAQERPADWAAAAIEEKP